jgi:L-threonylcarbamoyladenylate synthase
LNKVAEIVTVDPAGPEAAFSRCREVISSGGVIAYPTDTFYGLGADPKNPAAVKKLFSLKGRLADRPILVLIPDQAAVKDWAAEITPQAEDLMRKFWPGPLTLVFTAKKGVLPELTAGMGTIGLRIPGNELTRQLLAYLGAALTGTSANVSGGPDPRTAEEVEASFAGKVDLILDSGSTAGGKPSTIVDVRFQMPKIIREGAIPSEAFQ